MKKSINIALSFLLVLLTVLPSLANPRTVEAAGKYKDGEYDIPLTVLHATKDEASSMGRYVQDPSVIIKDGKASVTVTLTSSSMITAFQVENNGEFFATKIESENKEENTREASFTVEDLDSLMNAKVSVDTGHPQFGVMHHDVRLSFDTSVIDLVPEEVEKPTEPKEGEYFVPFTVLNEKDDGISSSGTSNMVTPAVITIEDGKYVAKVTLKNSQFFKDFLTEEKQLGSFADKDLKDAKVVSVDTEANTKVVKFVVQDLDEVLNIKIGIDTPGRYMAHNLRLSFNTTGLDIPELPKQPEKGVYSVPFTVLKDKSDDESSAGNNIVSPGELRIVDNQYEMTVTMTATNFFKEFRTETKQLGSFADKDFADVETISVDEAGLTRTVKFIVQDLEEVLNAKVGVDTPYMYMNHDIRIKFDTTGLDIPKLEVPEVPEIPEIPEIPEDKDEIDVDDLEDGFYSIEIAVLQDKVDEDSIMAGFIESLSYLKVKDGKQYLATTFLNYSWIESFQTEGNGKFTEAKVLSVDYQKDPEDENKPLKDTGTVEFLVDDLSKVTRAKVAVNVPDVYTDNHDVRLSFDVSTLKKVADKDYPVDENVPVKPTPKPVEPETVNPTPENSKEVGKLVDPHNLVNGTYTIPFEVLHQTKDEASLMMDYVETPGYLRVKDGKHYIAITLLKSSWIVDFKTEFNGELTHPKVLSTDKDKNTKVVEFEVNDIFALLNAWISVDVPGVYASDHNIRMSFDTDGIELVSKDEYPGLGFDRNGDPIPPKSAEKAPEKKSNNPKTADTTNTMKIMLLGLLMVGSLIPLVMKYRRRLIE